MAETTTKKRTTTTRKTSTTKKAAETKPVETESVVEEVKAVETPVAEPAPKMFSEADVQAMIAKAVAEAMARKPQVIVQTASPDAERIQFLYMAEVADDNLYEIGPGGMYGKIVGKTGHFSVPKAELSRAMDSMFRFMLERRWIVVVSGLTDEEREAYGVDYKDGEVLDKRMFTRMVELGDQMVDIFPKLCAGHREMVAKRYYEAYVNGNPAVTREIVVELNKISRQLDGGDGKFSKIIELMNEADLKK